MEVSTADYKSWFIERCT